jgi:hypothetical protein
MKKRRSFFKKILGIGFAGMAGPFINQTVAKSSSDTTFIHHVYFWLKNPDDPAVNKKFLQGLKEMGTIESISLLHIGTPADTDRPVIDNTYHYSFLIGFKDRKGHDIYQEHPIHEKFRNEFSDMWTRVLVYDSVDI